MDDVTGKITKEDIELKFNDKETSQKSISNYIKETYYTLGWDVDYAVPYSPAFAILGLSPTEVLPSNTAREFASSIINAADKNGNFQQGVAIDTSLMNMFGRRLTFKQYNANNLSRFVYRTRVSFAVTKGQEESDKSTRLALGFVFTPYDKGDYRGQEIKLLDKNKEPILDKNGKEQYTDKSLLVECMAKKIAEASGDAGNPKGLAKEIVETKGNNGKAKTLAAKIVGIKGDDGKEKTLDKKILAAKTVAAEKLAEEIVGASGNNSTAKTLAAKILADNLATDPGGSSRKEDQGPAEKEKIAKQCRDHLKKHWAGTKWTIGLAPKWLSKDGDTSDFKYSGAGFWTSFAIGLNAITSDWDDDNPFKFDLDNKNTSLALHARYILNEDVADPRIKGTFLEQDSFITGLMFQTGNDKWKASAEATFNITNAAGVDEDRSFRYALIFDRKLRDDVWLEFSVGKNQGREIQKNDLFGLVNLKWSFTELQRAGLFNLN